MREKELRKHAVCSLCKRKIGESGLPLFWTARIVRHGLKAGAIQRQDGLAAFFGGNSEIARVMGADEEMTQTIEDVEVTVCETCAAERSYPLLAMVEHASDEGEE